MQKITVFGTLNPPILFLDVMMKRFIFGQKQSKRTPLDKNTSGKRVTPVPLLSVKTAEDCLQTDRQTDRHTEIVF